MTILVDHAVGADEVDEVDEAAVKRELDETLEALRHPRSDEGVEDLLEKRRWCESAAAPRTDGTSRLPQSE